MSEIIGYANPDGSGEGNWASPVLTTRELAAPRTAPGRALLAWNPMLATLLIVGDVPIILAIEAEAAAEPTRLLQELVEASKDNVEYIHEGREVAHVPIAQILAARAYLERLDG